MSGVRVIGFEARDGICLELISDLKQAVASVKELQVTPDNVSPFIMKGAMQAVSGERVFVFIDGLFEKDERTPEVCQKLTEVVFEAVTGIVQKYELFEVRFVEVINYKINPQTDGYTGGKILHSLK